MGRILAIDFGDKRIGFALSDPTGIIAQPLCTVEWKWIDCRWNWTKAGLLKNPGDPIIFSFITGCWASGSPVATPGPSLVTWSE